MTQTSQQFPAYLFSSPHYILLKILSLPGGLRTPSSLGALLTSQNPWVSFGFFPAPLLEWWCSLRHPTQLWVQEPKAWTAPVRLLEMQMLSMDLWGRICLPTSSLWGHLCFPTAPVFVLDLITLIWNVNQSLSWPSLLLSFSHHFFKCKFYHNRYAE